MWDWGKLSFKLSTVADVRITSPSEPNRITRILFFITGKDKSPPALSQSNNTQNNQLKTLESNINEIFLIDLKQNKGIETALNTGLDWIRTKKYKYIARLDVDDIPLPIWLERQWAYCQKFPAAAVVSAKAVVIDEQKRIMNLPWKIGDRQ